MELSATSQILAPRPAVAQVLAYAFLCSQHFSNFNCRPNSSRPDCHDRSIAFLAATKILRSSFTMTVTKQALRGRKWYESMGSPRYILAPMVEGSEYAWRELSRRYGAELCYSPMLHARLFSESDKARYNFWSSMKKAKEEKLIVQFCANDPDILLKAATEVTQYADGVDINFGCPQGIARKGKYGAFLQDDWPLVHALINKLHTNLDIPVTAKIRIFPDKAKTLDYAKMVLKAGANILSVHCRTRDQKGQLTGLGDWSVLRYLRDNLPPETVLFANGNIIYHEDIHRCLKETGFDGMMVAETNLYNPGIFKPNCYPRVDVIMEEYLDLLDSLNDPTSRGPVKGHLFKILKPALTKHTDLRARLGQTRGDDPSILRDLLTDLKARINGDQIDDEGTEYALNEAGYRSIPWYRCQPYFRPLEPIKPGQGKALLKRAHESMQEGETKKRAVEV